MRPILLASAFVLLSATAGAGAAGSASTACLRPAARAMVAHLVRQLGPIHVTSTCGGRHARGSQHYRGNAVDFRPLRASRAQALAALRASQAVGGIGIYPSHLHADVGALKHSWVVGARSRHAGQRRAHRRHWAALRSRRYW